VIWHPVELKLESLDDRSAGYNITCVKKLLYWSLISPNFGEMVLLRVLFFGIITSKYEKGALNFVI